MMIFIPYYYVVMEHVLYDDFHSQHHNQRHFSLLLYQYTKRVGRAHVSLARGIHPVIL